MSMEMLKIAKCNVIYAFFPILINDFCRISTRVSVIWMKTLLHCKRKMQLDSVRNASFFFNFLTIFRNPVVSFILLETPPVILYDVSASENFHRNFSKDYFYTFHKRVKQMVETSSNICRAIFSHIVQEISPNAP